MQLCVVLSRAASTSMSALMSSRRGRDLGMAVGLGIFVFYMLFVFLTNGSGGDASAKALDASAAILNAGELFGIYPEGTRSRSGALHRGHTGVARLALRTGTPIIPVGIVGSREVQPPDAKLPRPFREVTIRFGAPIDVCRYIDRSSDPLVLRQITDEVMYEIRNLSGQEYIDTYATRKHESIPEEPAVVGARGSGTEHISGPVETTPQEAMEVGEPKSSAEVLRSRPLVDLVQL